MKCIFDNKVYLADIDVVGNKYNMENEATLVLYIDKYKDYIGILDYIEEMKYKFNFYLIVVDGENDFFKNGLWRIESNLELSLGGDVQKNFKINITSKILESEDKLKDKICFDLFGDIGMCWRFKNENTE
jgi:hypothetical protein